MVNCYAQGCSVKPHPLAGECHYFIRTAPQLASEFVSDKFFPSQNRFWRVITYFWAAPNSLLGILVGGVGLLFGGGVSIHRGCLEFHGGLSKTILARLGVVAMTLGHTVLGQNERVLEYARDHEQVHIRQYELWGPLFVPAYLGCSAWLW